MAVSRIAYVGHDGVIYAANADGSDRQGFELAAALSTWPTWSPDGSQIALSGFRSGDNGRGYLGVYLVRPGDTSPREIYSNEPGTDAIARGTPHYCLWSPNSQLLAFIAQTNRSGLTLFLLQAGGPAVPESLMDGGPHTYLGPPTLGIWQRIRDRHTISSTSTRVGACS